MGSTRWSDDEYVERAVSRKKSGKDAFEHNEDIRAGRAQSGVHQKMNPRGVIVRESRDSEAHPESHAVAVLFDVTGSMQSVPRVLQANLPRLMNLLIRKGYLEHPQIMVGAIGDATCDQAPLQIGQFESGIEIEEDLAKLYLEGGGGGHITESYELAMYFMAWHTALDCFEKRGKKGYLFVIGDEAPYPSVKRGEIQEVIGDGIQADIPFPEVIAKLRQRYEIYYRISLFNISGRVNWGEDYETQGKHDSNRVQLPPLEFRPSDRRRHTPTANREPGRLAPRQPNCPTRHDSADDGRREVRVRPR